MNYLSSIRDASAERRATEDVDRRLLHLISERESDPDFWSLKDRNRRDSAHCIFQYPAMMVPLVQRRLLSTVLEAKASIVSLYDPFVGSGTSLVSGMHFGLDVYGNDINPLAVLISRVRTARRADLTIDAIVVQIAREASADRRTKIECDLPNRDKWLRPQNVLGFVLISEAHNGKLREKTDREGFVSNPWSQNFQRLVSQVTTVVGDLYESIRRHLNAYRQDLESQSQPFETQKQAVAEADAIAQRLSTYTARAASLAGAAAIAREKIQTVTRRIPTKRMTMGVSCTKFGAVVA